MRDPLNMCLVGSRAGSELFQPLLLKIVHREQHLQAEEDGIASDNRNGVSLHFASGYRKKRAEEESNCCQNIHHRLHSFRSLPASGQVKFSDAVFSNRRMSLKGAK